MKHYGDITKLSGYDLPVVDVITGGSPCQDLSVAGKRAGLAGERSGLFMEQMRIVKEMRERDRNSGRTGFLIRPRYMVWENVPGAFSSSGGADFAAVLEEIIKVCEPGADVCVPVPNERWTKSGCYYASNGAWSIAWRVHDAQFWGVPQRRKRIALVADFGGLSAPEILFERKGLSWDSAESGAAWEETAGAIRDSIKGASTYCLQGNGIDRTETSGCDGRGWREDVSYTLNTIDRPAVYAVHQNASGDVREGNVAYTLGTNANASGRNTPMVYENHSQDSRYNPLGDVCETVSAKYGTGGNNQPLVVGEPTVYNGENITSPLNKVEPKPGDPCHTLGTDTRNYLVGSALCFGNRQLNQISMAAQANTLDTMHDQQAVMCIGNGQTDIASHITEEMAQTLNCMHDQQLVLASAIRRLTPLECERLQGYPDNWTDIGEWTDSKGKKHKEADSPRYKALGNSIAIPFWQFLARRICAQYERDIAMGSLFDGIGGFPFVFESCGAKAVWASEIEEFPIAVTKKHFPEKEGNNG